MSEKNGYVYQRIWFDFSFENNDIVSPTHTAMYLWFVELNNRMGWSEKFASPASQTMSAIGLKSYNTYKKIFDELVGFGFINVITESKNQYTACIIALSNFDKALYKALDKALIKHTPKQHESTEQSIDSINKQETLNIETNNKSLFPLPEIVKSKKEKKQFIKPTQKEVSDYFLINGFTDKSSQTAFKYYDTAEWKDSKGNQVLNWKQKMISVWFKDENKIISRAPQANKLMV